MFTFAFGSYRTEKYKLTQIYATVHVIIEYAASNY